MLGNVLEARLRRTMKLLQAQPTMEMLQTEEQLWQKSQTEMGGWLNRLTQRATQLETALGRLADLQKAWSQTLDSARSGQAPEAIIQQITAILPAIEAAQITLQTQRSAVLDLQGPVADEIAKCGTALAEIAKAQRMAVGGLAGRETLPIWSAERWAQARAAGFAGLHELAADPWAEIGQYLHDPSKRNADPLGAFSRPVGAVLRDAKRSPPMDGRRRVTGHYHRVRAPLRCSAYHFADLRLLALFADAAHGAECICGPGLGADDPVD